MLRCVLCSALFDHIHWQFHLVILIITIIKQQLNYFLLVQIVHFSAEDIYVLAPRLLTFFVLNSTEHEISTAHEN